MIEAAGFDIVEHPDPDGSHQSSVRRAQERRGRKPTSPPIPPKWRAPSDLIARYVATRAAQSGGADGSRARTRKPEAAARRAVGRGPAVRFPGAATAASIPRRLTLADRHASEAAYGRAPWRALCPRRKRWRRRRSDVDRGDVARLRRRDRGRSPPPGAQAPRSFSMPICWPRARLAKAA